MNWQRFKACLGIDVRSPVWAHRCDISTVYWSGGLYPGEPGPAYWISVEPEDYLVSDQSGQPEDLENVRVLHKDWFKALYQEANEEETT